MLRRRIHGDRPPVFHAVLFAPSSPEIPVQDIALHLQVRDHAVEILLSAFTEPGMTFHFKGIQLLLVLKQIHDLLAPVAGQLVIVPGVKIIPVPPVIGEDREPFSGNESCLPVKEFPIGSLPASGDNLPPHPGILFGIAGPPCIWVNMIFHGKSFRSIGEQRQESHLFNIPDQLLRRPDPQRVVPVQAAHDPLSRFIWHMQFLPSFYNSC